MGAEERGRLGTDGRFLEATACTFKTANGCALDRGNGSKILVEGNKAIPLPKPIALYILLL
jgi:hypothetical protein